PARPKTGWSAMAEPNDSTAKASAAASQARCQSSQRTGRKSAIQEKRSRTIRAASSPLRAHGGIRTRNVAINRPPAVPSGQRTLRRGNAARLAGIDLGRGAQHACDSLEARLRDMMVVRAVDVLDMQRDAGVLGERLEEFAHQLGVEGADLRGGEIHVPDEEGAAGNVHGG